MNLLGVFIAIGFIIGGMMMEGSHPSALFDIPAVMIVIGSSFGVCMVQFPLKTIFGTFGKLKWLIAPPRLDFISQAELLESMLQTARQQGLLALENQLGQIEDNFTRHGIQMIIDGVDKEQLQELLEHEIEHEEYELEQPAKCVEAIGGYAPCMGIIGAVLGLIHAMGLLDQPELLGPAIAVAFVATIYGVASANIILLPAGGRFKSINHDIAEFKYMTLEGLLSIANGENSMQLKRRLAVYTGQEA
ncbi:MAG: flagellar motor protein [Succinivibrionaceae bacterium]|nr:flagellar motor protein [Ruminobacter sp.]MDY5778398.1 flagellar motor protein [Succinivibrionaceae bacterium]MEE1341081.1 flagellar motor protein [Succinivibrionaceae bacterium]